MRKAWIAVLALGVAGCAEQAPDVRAPTAQSQPRAGVAMPPAWGVTVVNVSALVSDGGVTREVSGATCALSSPYSTAQFVAPATVSVPDLGPETPILRVDCSEGPRRGAVETQARLASTNGGLAGWPTVGVSVGSGGGGNTGVSVGGFWGGGWGTSGPGVQRAVYPDARVMMQ